MTRATINRIALPVPMILSALAAALALASILAGVRGGGDEGWQAHLFQLLIAAQLPVIAVVAATANWRRPRVVAGIVALYIAGLCVAFVPVALAGL